MRYYSTTFKCDYCGYPVERDGMVRRPPFGWSVESTPGKPTRHYCPTCVDKGNSRQASTKKLS